MKSPSINQSAALAGLISARVPIDTTSYLSGAGFVILLFEWAHGFTDEVRLMWKRPVTPSRAIFLYFRYGVLASHAFLTYGLSGQARDLSDIYCHTWLIVASLGGVIMLLLANVVSLRRFYVTWDYRRRITHILHGALIVSSLASVAFVIPSIRDLYENIQPENEIYHICLITQKPATWVGIWTPQVAFGLFVIGLTLYCAGERPRTVDVELIRRLQFDGAVYFMVGLDHMPGAIAFLTNIHPRRLCSVCVLRVKARFDWAMVTVVMARLMIRLEDMTLPRSK
ncbi:hypothetical protein OF83DRAFT_1155017 [Amylostereum chailletii]|nr:hypothetical protein OF83DRAFT_1155017 [Amylostereum chailletii]